MPQSFPKVLSLAVALSLLITHSAFARSVKRGVGVYPKTIDGPGFIDAFQKASESGDVIMHHVQLHWCTLTGQSFETAFGDYKWMRHLFDNQYPNLGLMLLIDVTPAADRRQIINLPKNFSNSNFGDPRLRSAYLEEVMWLADHFKPQYMALAVEIEGYYIGHPEDFDHFVSLYKEAHRLIKRKYPDMKLFVYFQYEGLQGLWRQLESQSQLPLDNLWFLIDRFVPELDAAGFSSYPEAFYSHPEQIPMDYYQRISNHTQLPIVFAEIGWSSKFNPQGKKTNTPEIQAVFIRRFASLIEGLNVELATWYYLHDMEGEPAFRHMPKWWATMGLRDTNGGPKPAWEAWNDPALWERLPNEQEHP